MALDEKSGSETCIISYYNACLYSNPSQSCLNVLVRTQEVSDWLRDEQVNVIITNAIPLAWRVSFI